MLFDDPRAQAVFEDYDARHQRELRSNDGLGRDDLLLPVGRNVGDFLRSLAVGRGARTILELGTSYGYSTLFLADAARQTGGRVISMDLVADKQTHAAAMLAKAGLDGFVEFRCGDAPGLIAADAEPLDLVLLDIWKDAYVAAFEAVYPRLAEEGIIVSDNMIHPVGARENVRRYREALKAKGDLQTALLPLGSGIELSIKWSPDNDSL